MSRDLSDVCGVGRPSGWRSRHVDVKADVQEREAWLCDGICCVQVAAEYCKDTTLLLMGVICLAASIEKWNLHKRIALRMVMVAGAKPGM